MVILGLIQDLKLKLKGSIFFHAAIGMSIVNVGDYCKIAHKYDIICFSQSYLDFTVPLDDNSLSLIDYNLTRADHPDDVKRRSVHVLQGKLIP